MRRAGLSQAPFPSKTNCDPEVNVCVGVTCPCVLGQCRTVSMPHHLCLDLESGVGNCVCVNTWVLVSKTG